MTRFALLVLMLPGAAARAQEATPPAAEELSRFVAGFGAEVREGFARVRAGTARFTDLDSAVAAGYARDVAQCIAHPHHGVMGYHHLNRSYLDTTVEVERPEILLYERHPDGRYRLTAVEYIIPYRVWPRDSVPPTIMGQSLKQEDQLNLWYLHMWIWKENPAGLFADWHPSVRCPATTPPGGRDR